MIKVIEIKLVYFNITIIFSTDFTAQGRTQERALVISKPSFSKKKNEELRTESYKNVLKAETISVRIRETGSWCNSLPKKCPRHATRFEF